MKVIPSISFKGNKPVTVEDDRYVHYSRDGSKLDLHGVLSLLSDYETVYLLDLDGIERRGLQTDVIRSIGTRKEVWADIGARDTATITDGYIAGADKVVISTKTMYSKELIDEASRISGEMIFCVDIKDDIVSPSKEIKNIPIKDLIRDAVQEGIDTIVIHDLSDTKFDRNLIDYLPDEDFELYIGGNIDVDDLNSYINIVDGFILGLEESIRWQERN
ncbi:MAG: HisA/HisF-related TIM barrel protein [Candidatus Saliniplasma sp.]